MAASQPHLWRSLLPPPSTRIWLSSSPASHLHISASAPFQISGSISSPAPRNYPNTPTTSPSTTNTRSSSAGRHQMIASPKLPYSRSLHRAGSPSNTLRPSRKIFKPGSTSKKRLASQARNTFSRSVFNSTKNKRASWKSRNPPSTNKRMAKCASSSSKSSELFWQSKRARHRSKTANLCCSGRRRSLSSKMSKSSQTRKMSTCRPSPCCATQEGSECTRSLPGSKSTASS